MRCVSAWAVEVSRFLCCLNEILFIVLHVEPYNLRSRINILNFGIQIHEP